MVCLRMSEVEMFRHDVQTALHCVCMALPGLIHKADAQQSIPHNHTIIGLILRSCTMFPGQQCQRIGTVRDPHLPHDPILSPLPATRMVECALRKLGNLRAWHGSVSKADGRGAKVKLRAVLVKLKSKAQVLQWRYGCQYRDHETDSPS